jgi:hypothetical protein
MGLEPGVDLGRDRVEVLAPQRLGDVRDHDTALLVAPGGRDGARLVHQPLKGFVAVDPGQDPDLAGEEECREPHGVTHLRGSLTTPDEVAHGAQPRCHVLPGRRSGQAGEALVDDTEGPQSPTLARGIAR